MKQERVLIGSIYTKMLPIIMCQVFNTQGKKNKLLLILSKKSEFS